LLADDNPINQKVGLSVLGKLGYRADLANNGLEVIKALEQKVYDLIFLDVQMPEMDGLEAARVICQRWAPEKRPAIIAMTGNALMGDREKCLAAGMDDYISKPVRVIELQAAIEKWGPDKSKRGDTTSFFRNKAIPFEELLDQSLLTELRGLPGENGKPMLKEMIELFLDRAPERLAEIGQSFQDGSKLQFHAHALKSMGLNLGAIRVVQLAQRLEDLGRAGAVDAAPQVFQELQSVFAQTKAQLVPLRSQ